MRQEIENWWKQGKNDLEKARVLFKSKNFDGTAFYCQQAVEKVLKAIILAQGKHQSIQGHSLVFLGREAGLPLPFFTGLKKLSPQYTIARYPDVSEDVPYELYDEPMAKEFVAIAEEVLAWTEKRLQ
ncbi:MAG: HEPN domain-containing protein [Candidatus Aenigmarchaeota archaeon]|nr:HEPN domain-containing protein [Candidatus Aenigmarchaeota archaeon]